MTLESPEREAGTGRGWLAVALAAALVVLVLAVGYLAGLELPVDAPPAGATAVSR